MKTRKTTIILIISLILPGFDLSHGSPMSEASVYQWDYRDFCNTTIPSYVDAYTDGDREIIVLSLRQNKNFQSLTSVQQEAFLRTLDYYHKVYLNSGSNVKALKESCLKDIERAINGVSYDQITFCHDVTKLASNMLTTDLTKEQKLENIRNRIYDSCMRKLNLTGDKSDEKNTFSN